MSSETSRERLEAFARSSTASEPTIVRIDGTAGSWINGSVEIIGAINIKASVKELTIERVYDLLIERLAKLGVVVP